jgi:hypothetical protein
MVGINLVVSVGLSAGFLLCSASRKHQSFKDLRLYLNLRMFGLLVKELVKTGRRVGVFPLRQAGERSGEGRKTENAEV